MNKSLEEITREIEQLQAEREKENVNRINAFGPIFRIQDELGGNLFGITFDKNIQEFDNDAYNQVVFTLLEKLNDMARLYQNKDKYVKDYFDRATFGISEEKFNQYNEEIRNSLKAIKVSNSKLDGIWEKQSNLAKEKAERLSETTKTGEKNTTGVPVIKAQIDNLNEEIIKLEQDIKLNEALLANAQNDELRNLYSDVIKATKKLIATKKGMITKLYNVVSKDDIDFYDKMKEEEKQEEQLKELEEEKARKEQEKREKFEQIRQAKQEEKINNELDEAQGIDKTQGAESPEETPQDVLDNQIKVDTTPETPKKCISIKRAGEFLKKILSSNAAKAIAVCAVTIAALTAGMAFAPGVMLGAAGMLGYQEVKKGMGK